MKCKTGQRKKIKERKITQRQLPKRIKKPQQSLRFSVMIWLRHRVTGSDWQRIPWTEKHAMKRKIIWLRRWERDGGWTDATSFRHKSSRLIRNSYIETVDKRRQFAKSFKERRCVMSTARMNGAAADGNAAERFQIQLFNPPCRFMFSVNLIQLPITKAGIQKARCAVRRWCDRGVKPLSHELFFPAMRFFFGWASFGKRFFFAWKRCAMPLLLGWTRPAGRLFFVWTNFAMCFFFVSDWCARPLFFVSTSLARSLFSLWAGVSMRWFFVAACWASRAVAAVSASHRPLLLQGRVYRFSLWAKAYRRWWRYTVLQPSKAAPADTDT